MKLDDKRKIVEVLLCAGPPPQPSCGEAAGHLGYGRDIAVRAIELWSDVFSTFDGNYQEIAVDAAYRLIESSPALRLEWWSA